MRRHLTDDTLVLSIRHADRLPHHQRQHLAQCLDCQRRQSEWQAHLPKDSIPQLPAPPYSRVDPTRGRPSVRARRTLRWVLVGTAVIIVGLFSWPRALWRTPPPGPIALETLLTTRTVDLKAVSPHVRGAVSVRANRRTGWLLVSYRRLSPPPAGKVYEAWWIENGHHIRAGVFGLTGGSRSLWLHTSRPVGHAVAIGITVEPAPGTMHPTGPKQFGAPLS